MGARLSCAAHAEGRDPLACLNRIVHTPRTPIQTALSFPVRKSGRLRVGGHASDAFRKAAAVAAAIDAQGLAPIASVAVGQAAAASVQEYKLESGLGKGVSLLRRRIRGVGDAPVPTASGSRSEAWSQPESPSRRRAFDALAVAHPDPD